MKKTWITLTLSLLLTGCIHRGTMGIMLDENCSLQKSEPPKETYTPIQPPSGFDQKAFFFDHHGDLKNMSVETYAVDENGKGKLKIDGQWYEVVSVKNNEEVLKQHEEE